METDCQILSDIKHRTSDIDSKYRDWTSSLETMVEGFQCNSKHIYTKADLTEDAQNCSLKQSQISCHCNKHCLEKCYKLYYCTVYQMLKSPDNERKGIILLTCQRYHLSPRWCYLTILDKSCPSNNYEVFLPYLGQTIPTFLCHISDL